MVIFVKSVQRCIAMAQLLVEQNFPAIAIHRGMSQEERLSRYRILLSRAADPVHVWTGSGSYRKQN